MFERPISAGDLNYTVHHFHSTSQGHPATYDGALVDTGVGLPSRYVEIGDPAAYVGALQIGVWLA